MKSSMGKRSFDNARALFDRKEYSSAEAAFAEVLQERRKTLKLLGLSSPDPKTLLIMHWLGRTRYELRKDVEANKLFERVLEGRLKVLRQDHPETILSKHWLGTTSMVLGNYPRAKRLFKQALKGQEREIGRSKSDTLWTRHWLGNTLFFLGQYTEAERYFRQVLMGGRRTQNLALEAQYRNITKYWLARTLFEQKNYIKAEKLCREILTNREEPKVLKAEVPASGVSMVRQVGNPDHTLTRYWLARIKFELGQYRVARGYFQQALTAKEKSEKILCNDDPELLLYKYWLARAQFEIAAYPEAEKLFLQALEGQERALEAASPDTRSSRYWLARTLFGLKRYSEAEKLLRPVLEEPPKDGSIGHEELLLLTKIRDLQSPNLLRQAKGHVETDLAASTSQMLVGNQHSLKKRDVVHDGQVHGPLLAPTTRAGRDISDRSLPLLDEGIISRPHTYALAIHTIPLLPKPFRSRDPSPATLSNRDSDMTLLTPKTHLLNRSKSRPSTPCKRKSLPERPKSALASIPQVGATVMDASSDTDSEESNSWWKDFRQTSSYIDGLRDKLQDGQQPKRVKVAILDTGFDRMDPMFKEAKNSLLGDAEIVFQDFVVPGSTRPVDSTGHGTRVAYFLLQITRNVDLWIARVFEDDKGTKNSPKRVALAIEEAIKAEVDIISISLGFDTEIPEIESAITNAYSNSKNRILIFAAASNERQRTIHFPISFPASMKYGVFCINAHPSGPGEEWSTFNPRPIKKRDNFCIIGEDLLGPGSKKFDETGKKRVKTSKRLKGTSYATPIAAGVAALILEYCRLSVFVEDHRFTRDTECLKKYDHMVAVFKTMCSPTYRDDLPNVLMPWRLLRDMNGGHITPWTFIDVALANKDA